MYVIHVPLHVAILHYAGAWLRARAEVAPIATDVLWTLAVGVISFALALVSFALIERPALRLRKRWAA